ncbi:hypothetical protein V1264_005368 [Littorina saxatilis]|uniref:Mutator-like transposase domain-containing protein n=2 Tax=Littorina saxatilis TaxID=31220 RepID=A0AAN9AZR4_9CAEN
MFTAKFNDRKRFVGQASGKRKKQLALARIAEQEKSTGDENAPREVGAAECVVLDGGGDAHFSHRLQVEPRPVLCDIHDNQQEIEGASASAKKLRRFSGADDLQNAQVPADVPAEPKRTWCIVECGQLNSLLSDVKCPECEAGHLTIRVGESMGLSQELALCCDSCQYRRSEFSSPRESNRNHMKNVPFDVNKQIVLYSHEIGSGYSSVEKLCTVFGMPVMNKSSYQRIDKKVNASILAVTNVTLVETVEHVNVAYRQTFPQGRADVQFDEEDEDAAWEEDDGILWVDVAFDGTWHKRGFSSHYGVGVVVDVLTGLVLDFSVKSTYCHTCAMNKEKLEEMTPAQQLRWEQQHRAECSINHQGSAKSMERDAALELWGRSVERHNLRYRTMLSDGDSTAFNAVAAAQPYGPTRPITKLECTNHLPKRMGTALRKAAKDERLGGRGEGRLTKEKCQRLQNYFRSAILNNLEDQRAMEQAIWATFFHVTSTDEDPHHDRCPAGPASWCFFQKARAEGQPPPPHAEHNGTALSREVSHAVLPIYRRMTNPILLNRVAHGKTQNSNESLHNVMWGHCPKEIFVGKGRVEAATAEAVAKFNRGNFALAQVMDHMSLPITDLMEAALAKKDKVRIQKAEKATAVAAVAARRARCAGRQRQLEQQEDQEGEVYGAGLMGDGGE